MPGSLLFRPQAPEVTWGCTEGGGKRSGAAPGGTGSRERSHTFLPPLEDRHWKVVSV